MQHPAWREGKYLLEEKIGKGAFSEVYSARDSKGKKVAIKKIFFSTDTNAVTYRMREIEANLRMKEKCPKGVTKLLDYYEWNGNLCLVFEFIEGKELFYFMQERDFKPLSERKARNLFSQMVGTVLRCHQRKVFHRDIKLDNFILTKKEKIKLIDFGLCTTESKGSTEFVGSIDFGDSEILAQRSYKPDKADVFSLGTVLFVLLFGIMPFDSIERLKFLQGKIPAHPKLQFPSTSKVSDEALDLIIKMLQVEPCNRIELQAVLHHKWMSRDKYFCNLFHRK